VRNGRSLYAAEALLKEHMDLSPFIFLFGTEKMHHLVCVLGGYKHDFQFAWSLVLPK
jgi:hypothetical protein